MVTSAGTSIDFTLIATPCFGWFPAKIIPGVGADPGVGVFEFPAKIAVWAAFILPILSTKLDAGTATGVEVGVGARTEFPAKIVLWFVDKIEPCTGAVEFLFKFPAKFEATFVDVAWFPAKKEPPEGVGVVVCTVVGFPAKNDPEAGVVRLGAAVLWAKGGQTFGTGPLVVFWICLSVSGLLSDCFICQ